MFNPKRRGAGGSIPKKDTSEPPLKFEVVRKDGHTKEMFVTEVGVKSKTTLMLEIYRMQAEKKNEIYVRWDNPSFNFLHGEIIYPHATVEEMKNMAREKTRTIRVECQSCGRKFRTDRKKDLCNLCLPP